MKHRSSPERGISILAIGLGQSKADATVGSIVLCITGITRRESGGGRVSRSQGHPWPQVGTATGPGRRRSPSYNEAPSGSPPAASEGEPLSITNPTFELLVASLLPGARGRWMQPLLADRPLAAVLARPRDHADAVPGMRSRRSCSGQARRLAEEELKRAAAAGVRHRGPRRGRLSRPGCGASSIHRSSSTCGERCCRTRASSSLAIVGSRAVPRRPGSPGARSAARDLAAAGAHRRVRPGPRHRHRRPPGSAPGRRAYGGGAGLRARSGLSSGERASQPLADGAWRRGVGVPAGHAAPAPNTSRAATA